MAWNRSPKLHEKYLTRNPRGQDLQLCAFPATDVQKGQRRGLLLRRLGRLPLEFEGAPASTRGLHDGWTSISPNHETVGKRVAMLEGKMLPWPGLNSVCTTRRDYMLLLLRRMSCIEGRRRRFLGRKSLVYQMTAFSSERKRILCPPPETTFPQDQSAMERNR